MGVLALAKFYRRESTFDFRFERIRPLSIACDPLSYPPGIQTSIDGLHHALQAALAAHHGPPSADEEMARWEFKSIGFIWKESKGAGGTHTTRVSRDPSGTSEEYDASDEFVQLNLRLLEKRGAGDHIRVEYVERPVDYETPAAQSV